MTTQTQHDRAIADLALRQHGNVTRSQLLAIGLTAEMIKHRVRVGRLHPVHPGVYAVGRSPNMPVEHAAAAVLACGPWAALCCSSALGPLGDRQALEPALRRRRPQRPGPPRHQVPSALDAAPPRPHDTARHSHHDSGADAPRRCAVPHRATTEESRQRRAVLAVHDRLASRGGPGAQPDHRGTALLIPFAAETRTGITRSDLEDMFKKLCKDYGLPTPLTNVRIAGYKADAYFPEHGLIVEIDSWEFHRSRISFEENRDRDADMLAAGLVTTRVTDERMKSDPAKEAARLQKILSRLERGRRGPRGGPPACDP